MRQVDFNTCDLVGYLCTGCSTVAGDFNGEYDEAVGLDNGMVFTLNEGNYNYAYRPDVAIFVTTFTYQGKPHTSYKLLVEGELYEVTRLR